MTEYELIKLLSEVIDDFLPNIGTCVLQDYGKLNTALIESAKYLEKANVKEVVQS